MVMTPNSEMYDGSCSSADTLTSPGSSTATSEGVAFFSDEEMANIESLDIASMMTPLIKEELKTSICRRLAENGKELPLVDLQTVQTNQLSEEDEEKRNMRRLRNKMAAQKCRSKKREKADMLEQEAEKLEERQETLKDEVDGLKRELEVLQDMLDAHVPFCKKLRACADINRLNDVHICLSNDHTYTLTLENNGHNNNDIVGVPSLSDIEFD